MTSDETKSGRNRAVPWWECAVMGASPTHTVSLDKCGVPPVLLGPDSGRKIAAYIKQHESEQHHDSEARRNRTNERQD